MIHPVYAKAGHRIEAEKAEKPTKDKAREAVLIASARTIVAQDGNCCGRVWIKCKNCPFKFIDCGYRKDSLLPAKKYLEEHDPAPLTPSQEIALIAQPYMPHDKWVELYEAIQKALGIE